MFSLILTIVFCITVIVAVVVALWLEYDYYKVKVTVVSSVPWMRRAVKKVLISEIKDKGIEPKVIYELGCGWGPLVVDAAKVFPKATVKGIEFSFLASHFSRLRAKIWGLKNVQILRKNFFDHDLGDADVLVFYMLESILMKLSPKFIKELKPGAIIISNTFVIKDWTPIAVHEIVKKPIPLNVYVYKVPESLPENSKH